MAVLRCPTCGAESAPETARYACPCGDVVDVDHRWKPNDRGPRLRLSFVARRTSNAPVDRSGVWRFRELVHPRFPAASIVTLGEGNTPLVASPAAADWTGLSRLVLKHEGWNPTGSFKDRGMTVAVSRAAADGARAVACASTGNTAASMAAYAAHAGLDAVVLVPDGGVASGKAVQATAHGARTLRIRGNFDDAMRLVREHADASDLALVNSLNPFRIEGQKSIVLELLEELDEVPDWIVFPAGNLGNCAAFGRALVQAREVGLLTSMPRLAAVQARGASPFARAFREGFAMLVEESSPDTIASAIRIGAPVSFRRAVRSLAATDGVATAVDDDAILAAKGVVDAAGIGAEPASCAAVAGARALQLDGTIAPDASVVCVLTGHLLKDPETARAQASGDLPGRTDHRNDVTIDADADELRRALEVSVDP